jgi:hypothetical protein
MKKEKLDLDFILTFEINDLPHKNFAVSPLCLCNAIKQGQAPLTFDRKRGHP